jgi:predicted dehydrogenase
MKAPARLTRRRLLGRVLPAGGLAFLAAPAIGLSGAPASERLRLAWIGCGGRGRQLLELFTKLPDVEVPLVCDVNAPRREQAREMLEGADPPRRAEGVADYRALLERRDVDAVVIATCEHWHGLPFIEACRAGKHIFVEKPLSHTVVEGRAMVEAAKKAGVIAVMGTQQRAGAHFQKAVELVRSGRLGKVAHVECWNYHDVARQRGGRPADRPPPAGLLWDRWLGPAPEVPFNPLRLSYSWWFDYGGGMMTNWTVHHIDVILWAMGYAPPRSVQASGGLMVTDTLSDAPDLVDASWEFPDWVLRYSYSGFSNFHRLQSRPHHHGILFYGSEATLALDRHGYEIYDNSAPGKTVEKEPRSEQDGPWQEHFVRSVKEGKKPAVGLEESHQATACCLIANIAYRLKRRIRWDGAAETVPSDTEAAALLSRPRRKGYELPAT